MAQRTFLLTGVATDFSGNPIANAPCSFQPLVPGGLEAVDGNGKFVQTLPVSFTTAADGSFSETVDFPGDFQSPYVNTQVRATINGVVTDSPVGFGYAASIALTAWIAAPVTSGLVVMRAVYTRDDNTGIGGATAGVSLSDNAIVTATGQILSAGVPVPAVSGADGTLLFSLNPNSLLNPSNLGYSLSIGGESTTWSFTVPAVVDVYRGAWNSATAYAAAAGSSNGDVVTNGGVLYRCILANTNQAPPNATYWQVVVGLPTDLISAHITAIVAGGGVVIDTTGVAASPNLATTSADPINPALTLDDDLVDLAARIGTRLRWLGAWSSTTAYLANDVVSLAGADYVCILGNTNQTLPNVTYWTPIGGSGGGTSDATPSTVGVVEVDQSPASGHPIALTAARLGASAGVAPLGGDGQLPSAFLPAALGTVAEAGRWTRSPSNPILAATAGWDGSAVAENSIIVDPTQYVMSYRGGWSTTGVGLAFCPLASDPTNPANWTKYGSNPIYSGANQQQPRLLKFGTTYYLYFVQGGIWKVATTTSLTVWPAAVTALALPAGVSQWANSCVIRDPDGTWHGLLEGLTSGTWRIYLLTGSTDGVTGWTVGNGGSPLATLDVAGTGGAGGPFLLPAKVDGLYQLWYHNNGLPGKIYHATSPGFANDWTQRASNPVLSPLGTGFEIDQAVGPCLFEVRGVSYMSYDGDDNTADSAGIGITSIPATLHQVINGTALPVVDPSTTEGDLLYRHGGALARLGVGSNGQVLGSNGTDPVWTGSTGPSVTTKGDLQGYAAAAARVPVGLDGTFLEADSTQALGVKWGTPVGELLMADGVSAPPVPCETEDQTDWLYGG